MEYTEYGVIWPDQIERCSDSWDEMSEEDDE